MFITEFMADFFLFLTEVTFSILIPSGFLLAILSNCIQNSPVSDGLFQITTGETIYQYGVPWLSLDMLIGSLGNDDGDVNESRKKAIGLDWQNNNFTRASRFLYISLPSLHDYDVKMRNFTFCGGLEHNWTTTFFFFS